MRGWSLGIHTPYIEYFIFSGAELYSRLEKYILTEDELRDNGYPRPSEEAGGQVKFYKERETKDILLKGR